MNPFHAAEVLSVRHWTAHLFSFTTTREDSFRFLGGQFVMIGLPVDGRPLMRAYSSASSPCESRDRFGRARSCAADASTAGGPARPSGRAECAEAFAQPARHRPAGDGDERQAGHAVADGGEPVGADPAAFERLEAPP
mgnify:CR=1 FL=1